MSWFGMAHVKQEGAPMHPGDIIYQCGCAGCEWAWERQLREWADYNRMDPPSIGRDL